MEQQGIVEINSPEELRALLGEPHPHVANKDEQRLLAVHKDWLAASPFCLVATAGEDGSCDVSPKGDPAGFAHVIDDVTIAIPERPGNRRADGFHNILTNPHVGLIFVIPGRGDTLRINGRARLLREAPFFADMEVRGHRPRIAMLVEIEQIFFHCSKAFLRAEIWRPETWNPEVIPSRAKLAKALDRPNEPIEGLERYYGPEYVKHLYD